MPAPLMTEAEFIQAWQEHGSASKMSKATGIEVRTIYNRRHRLQQRGWKLETTDPCDGYETRVHDPRFTFPREIQHEIHDGAVVVSSDHHYWPHEISVAHKALLEVCRRVKPRMKVLNGDIFDGVSVSRHPPFGWSDRPTVKEELEACQERTHEIEMALPKGCEKVWNIGNHCMRFERTLAVQAKEFMGLQGTRLVDHFPSWDMRWSTLINPDAKNPVMVKHRIAGGVHAGYNNAMKSGFTTVTGHTHLLEAKPWGDYRGRRYGIQTGTVSDLHSPAFEYHENSPSSACSGFVVLTFKDGEMLPPDLCEVIEGKAYFRGECVA